MAAAVIYVPQAFVTAPEQLFLLRFLLGVFNAATIPAVFAIIAYTVPTKRQGGAFGLSTSATQMGNLIGPTMGGIIMLAFGIQWVFLVTAAVLLVVAATVWRYIQDINPAPREKAAGA